MLTSKQAIRLQISKPEAEEPDMEWVNILWLLREKMKLREKGGKMCLCPP